MLEARIQQLQTDIVLDIQHAEVQFVKAPLAGRGMPSGRSHKSMSQEKSDIPKSGQTVSKGASKSQPSRWMEKLTEEKKNKLKKQQRLQQKFPKNVKEKPVAKSKGVKSSTQMLPGTSKKIISSQAKKTKTVSKTSRRPMKLSEEIRAAVSSTATSTASATAAAATPHTKTKWKEPRQKPTDSNAADRVKELAQIEEVEKKLSQQVNHWASSGNPEPLQANGTEEETACGDIQLSISSYLEACVFAGDIDRAHCFLLNQHRMMSRRKHLNTNVYNIMMRVWAKKVSSSDCKLTDCTHLDTSRQFQDNVWQQNLKSWQ